MGRIIAITNQKGGVGKTTTAINLSACLAEAGQRVLTVDFDPQGNATSGLGLEKGNIDNTVYELLMGECQVGDCIMPSVQERLDVMPSDVDLSGAEIELLDMKDKENILKENLNLVKDNYDFIIIDCPPSLNMLTINSMTTADSVLVPIQCEYYALEGLSQLIHTINLVKERLNPNLNIDGVVFTMYDSRTNLSMQVVENVKQNLNQKVYNTLIPRNIRLAEAPSYGMPINMYDPKSAGAEAYMQLAIEEKSIGENGMAARGLGKGLDSLIPNALGETKTKKEAVAKAKSEATTEEKEPQTLVKITKVEPNREQPRKNFDEDALQELADSIKQFGLLQPILVQDRKDYYEIIAGERRWRAAKLAGLKEVPIIVKEFTEQEIVEISLIENIQRENLNPIEEAMAYKRLLKEFNLKQDEVAERVSKSRTAVTNSMRLLKLNDRVQQMIIDDMISTGHARALLAIEDEEQQYMLANKIFDEKLSVRETEKLVKALKNPKKEEKKPEVENQFVYTNLEEQMKSLIGTKVSVHAKANGKGKIEIEYYSPDDLERIYELLMTIQHN